MKKSVLMCALLFAVAHTESGAVWSGVMEVKMTFDASDTPVTNVVVKGGHYPGPEEQDVQGLPAQFQRGDFDVLFRRGEGANSNVVEIYGFKKPPQGSKDAALSELSLKVQGGGGIGFASVEEMEEFPETLITCESVKISGTQPMDSLSAEAESTKKRLQSRLKIKNLRS
jgi:hypothetical protein